MTCSNLRTIHHIQCATATLLHALHKVAAVLAAAHVDIFQHFIIMAFFFDKLCHLMTKLLICEARRCSTSHHDFYINVIHCSAGVDDAFSLSNHIFINLRRSAASFQLNGSHIRHNIAAGACIEHTNINTTGALAMTRNRIQRDCCLSSCQQCILALLRSSTCMCRNTGEEGIQLRCCQEAVRQRNQTVVSRSLEADMTAKQIIYIVNYACIDHSIRTAHALLCRLEDQLNRAGQTRFICCQKLCCCQANGYVAIMTAGMHSFFMLRNKALLTRTVCFFLVFLNIVAVHIEAEGNSFARLLGFHRCHDTGLAAGHFRYQRAICTLADSTLHIFLQLCCCRHAHHRLFVNNVCAKGYLIA